MDLLRELTEKNEVLAMSDPITLTDQGHEEIDESNSQHVIERINMLVVERAKYNIENIPSPTMIKRENYIDTSSYKAAKEEYFSSYKNEYKKLDNEIKRLREINTKICFEDKKEIDKKAIDAGTFYSNDEYKYLNEKVERRLETSKKASKVYYEKNRDEIKLKRKIKQHNLALEEIQKNKLSKYDNPLITTNKIIKPICLCGKKCDVIKFSNLQKHSNCDKHQLFKSVIALIHYKRQDKKLKNVIDKLNKDYINYKKVVRVHECGRSRTITNKTDKDIIQLYKDFVRPMNENISHQLKPSYIEKRDYTEKYKMNVKYLLHTENPLIKR